MRAAALCVALALLGAPAQAACRLALALGMDISASVDSAEYEIQRGGLHDALRDTEIRAAILGQEGLAQSEGDVWIAIYEWSGWQQQDMLAPWTALRTLGDIDALAARVAAHERPYDSLSTAIGVAMLYGARLFETLPEPCARRVIDLSGDGANNQDMAPSLVRGVAALAGITVNGLAIRGEDPDPAIHYRQEVIHGPGAFVIEARAGFPDFPDAIRAKLLREIRPPMIVGRAPR
jgi:hypothetical protein